MHCTRVLAFIVLLVGLVHSFSWDIVVGGKKRLNFYNNGTLTQTKVIPSASYITSVTYDPVHYRVLFSDKNSPIPSISSFDLLTNKTQRLVTTANSILRVVYDPATQTLYWKDFFLIYSFSLNPASSNKTNGNLLVTLEHYCNDLAVDSCGGYIYWITDYEIERARLDGSGREILIDSKVNDRRSLAIDQKTQKMYWIEKIDSSDEQWSIKSANFNGKNITTPFIVRNTRFAFSLAVSKDFIYWQNYKQDGIWQLPKYLFYSFSQTVARKLQPMSSSDCERCHRIAANYEIKEQIQGIKSCDALQRLIPNDSKSECTESVCQNYCIQGECSVSAEGQPTCSCKAGYSGERCEVNACHKHCLNGGNCSLNEEGKPACQCTEGYDGERCDESICKGYCFQGYCRVGAEGQPKCSCMTGYSGERCEENACHKHCLNGGICSLNEENEPACQCTAGYDGGRCELSANKDDSCDAGNSGEGTVSACHQFCLNHGACYLNEANEPVCQCTANYVGKRCHVPAFIAKWVQHAYEKQGKARVTPVTLSDAVETTQSTPASTDDLFGTTCEADGECTFTTTY